MFFCEIADTVFEIHNKYKYTYSLCKDYLTVDKKPECTIECTDGEIAGQKSRLEECFSDGYAEGICIYRKICYYMLNHDGFLFHSSCVEMNGETYCFTAPSGTGKTTHSLNWIKAFGDEAKIINGDKPIVRIVDGSVYVYGTPFCGKERLNINKKSKMKAICFITRSNENSISRIDENKAVTKLLKQILLPKEEDEVAKTLEILDKIVDKVPLYELKCNTDVESAIVAYNGMKG